MIKIERQLTYRKIYSRIYLTKEQEEYAQKAFDGCRFVWNYVLKIEKRRFRNNKKLHNFYELSNLVTKIRNKKKYQFLLDIEAKNLHHLMRDLSTAFDRFYQKIDRFPKPKSFYNKGKQTYTTNVFKSKTKGSDKEYWSVYFVSKHHLRMPKIGIIRTKISKSDVMGRMINVTLSKTKAAKYYISITYEVWMSKRKILNNESSIGIDLGTKTLVTLSNGEKIENKRFRDKVDKKIKKLERQLSRKENAFRARRKKIGNENIERSNRQYQKRIQLAKAHDHICEQRRDYYKKITLNLVRTYDIICAENLDIVDLLKKNNKYLNKSFNDAALSLFIRYLLQRYEWYGNKLIRISKWFPSSRLCSVCGFKDEYKPMNIREWQCPLCKAHHDRDINAALNILEEGMKVYNYEQNNQSLINDQIIFLCTLGLLYKPFMVWFRNKISKQ